MQLKTWALAMLAVLAPGVAWGQQGTPTFQTLITTGTITTGTTLLSTQRPGAAMFNSYNGDQNHPWFTGASWAFGYRFNSNTDPVGIRPTVVIQRDPVYTGAIAGNPSTLSVVNNVGANVTGLENAIIATTNVSATSGIFTSLISETNTLVPGGQVIATNVVAKSTTGRKSSIDGTLVANEFDVNASGPDDAGTRINTEMIVRENQTSTDGATTFLVAGSRVRGPAVRVGQTGALTVPVSSTYGHFVTTSNGTQGGLVGSFGSAFASDGATTAGFNATSAVETLNTSTSFLGGVTTITLTTTNDANAHYVWPGALVTGTNIAANTHVLTYAYDSNVTVTITIDTPTSGALSNGQTLTFTNNIEVGFKASGYMHTAAFQSPNFLVDPVGVVTGASFKAGATAGVTCAGAPTGAFASTGGVVTHC